jgi:hypothetical protein
MSKADVRAVYGPRLRTQSANPEFNLDEQCLSNGGFEIDCVSPWQPTRAVLCFWNGRLDEVNLKLGEMPQAKAKKISNEIQAEYGRPQKEIEQLGYGRLWRDGGTIVRVLQIGYYGKVSLEVSFLSLEDNRDFDISPGYLIKN